MYLHTFELKLGIEKGPYEKIMFLVKLKFFGEKPKIQDIHASFSKEKNVFRTSLNHAYIHTHTNIQTVLGKISATLSSLISTASFTRVTLKLYYMN